MTVLIRTKALVLELLAAVCLVRGGHDIILSAFDNFKEVRQVGTGVSQGGVYDNKQWSELRRHNNMRQHQNMPSEHTFSLNTGFVAASSNLSQRLESFDVFRHNT